MNDNEIRKMDDAYCHEHLIANKISINFDRKFNEIKYPHK